MKSIDDNIKEDRTPILNRKDRQLGVLGYDDKKGYHLVAGRELPEFIELLETDFEDRTAVRQTILHQDYIDEFAAFIKNKEKNPYEEIAVRIKNKEKYQWYRLCKTIFFNESGMFEKSIIAVYDVDDEVQNYNGMKYRLEVDTLTQIYNKEKFCLGAKKMLLTHPKQKYAILYMDIDRFRLINEMFGVEEGDLILKSIADCIRKIVNEQGIYGRVHSDIFCICMEYKEKEDILQMIQDLTKDIQDNSIHYQLRPYFGICCVEDMHIPVNIMCDWAKLAARVIKGSYDVNYAFYNQNLREHILKEKKLEASMKTALQEEQFEVYLQPKYDIATSKIIGAEALARWKHPEHGFLSPKSFLSLFERNGFIIELDNYVWEQVCKMLREWLDKGWEPVPVSMNISGSNIHDENFEKKLLQYIEKYDIPPQLIELELTEEIFVEDTGRLYRIMQSLRDKGFLLSMDDFGSGYSALNMLKNAPVDIVKIDRHFFSEMVSTNRGKSVLRYMIAMARQLDLQVIAEGVTNLEQAVFLLESGCQFAQGYYYCESVPVKEFERILYIDKEENIPDMVITNLVNEYEILSKEIFGSDIERMPAFVGMGVYTYEGMRLFKKRLLKILNTYRAVIQANSDAFFEIDLSEDTLEMHGRLPKWTKLRNYQEFVSYILSQCTEEDRITTRRILSVQHLQNMLDAGEKQIIYEYKVKSGETFEKVMLTLLLDSDENGILDNFVICYKNADDARRQEERLKDINYVAGNLMNLSQNMCSVYDYEAKKKIHSVRWYELFGGSDALEWDGTDVEKALADEEAVRVIADIRQKIDAGEKDIEAEYNKITLDGKIVRCRDRIHILQDAAGNKKKAVSVITILELSD